MAEKEDFLNKLSRDGQHGVRRSRVPAPHSRLYGRDGLATDNGASPEGSGFSGMVFTYVVRSEERVDDILAEADKAGATILKPAATLEWGGYGGTFADPDGYIWNVQRQGQGPALRCVAVGLRPRALRRDWRRICRESSRRGFRRPALGMRPQNDGRHR